MSELIRLRILARLDQTGGPADCADEAARLAAGIVARGDEWLGVLLVAAAEAATELRRPCTHMAAIAAAGVLVCEADVEDEEQSS